MERPGVQLRKLVLWEAAVARTRDWVLRTTRTAALRVLRHVNRDPFRQSWRAGVAGRDGICSCARLPGGGQLRKSGLRNYISRQGAATAWARLGRWGQGWVYCSLGLSEGGGFRGMLGRAEDSWVVGAFLSTGVGSCAATPPHPPVLERERPGWQGPGALRPVRSEPFERPRVHLYVCLAVYIQNNANGTRLCITHGSFLAMVLF